MTKAQDMLDHLKTTVEAGLPVPPMVDMQNRRGDHLIVMLRAFHGEHDRDEAWLEACSLGLGYDVREVTFGHEVLWRDLRGESVEGILAGVETDPMLQEGLAVGSWDGDHFEVILAPYGRGDRGEIIWHEPTIVDADSLADAVLVKAIKSLTDNVVEIPPLGRLFYIQFLGAKGHQVVEMFDPNA